MKENIVSAPTPILVLDLDYTLAYYKDEMEELFEILSDFKFSEEQVLKALSESEKENFSFISFYRILVESTGIEANKDLFFSSMQDWFRRNYILYDDARWFLSRCLKQVTVVIVTAGDKAFQKKKIKHLGFIPNDVVVVPMGMRKLDTLRGLQKQYGRNIIFVDDNPNEFDVPLEFVRYVRMVRYGSPHRLTYKENQRSIVTVTSFFELGELVAFKKEAV